MLYIFYNYVYLIPPPHTHTHIHLFLFLWRTLMHELNFVYFVKCLDHYQWCLELWREWRVSWQKLGVWFYYMKRYVWPWHILWAFPKRKKKQIWKSCCCNNPGQMMRPLSADKWFCQNMQKETVVVQDTQW